MSHHHRGWCDISSSPCRTPRSCEATCMVDHVALDDGVVRHRSSCMSLLTTAWCDIVADECRTAREREATSSRWNVAPHASVRRHRRDGMSPFTSAWSDIVRLVCRFTRGGEATSSRDYVAPHPCDGATCVGRSLIRHSGKATLALSHVARGAWVVRHAKLHGVEHGGSPSFFARHVWDLVRQTGKTPCPRDQPPS
jgi:hypothetical protein